MVVEAFSCEYINVTNIEEKMDVLYEIFAGIADMEIMGFWKSINIS